MQKRFHMGNTQLYFSGSFDVATGPRGIRTKFVPGASGRGWPRFRIECSFRTIMKFPLTSSDHVAARKGTGYAFWTSYLGRVGICPSLDIFRVKIFKNKIEKIPMPS